MPPRKKPSSSSSSSSSKKSHQSNHPTQPSKFGIQHFFERHSQNPKNVPKPTLSSRQNPIELDDEDDHGAAALPTQNPSKPSPSSKENAAQNTPPAEDTLPQNSPEISKSLSLKGFKFSPGMVALAFWVFSFDIWVFAAKF